MCVDCVEFACQRDGLQTALLAAALSRVFFAAGCVHDQLRISHPEHADPLRAHWCIRKKKESEECERAMNNIGVNKDDEHWEPERCSIEFLSCFTISLHSFFSFPCRAYQRGVSLSHSLFFFLPEK